MHEATVHEHMGEDLPEIKVFIFRKPQRKPLVHDISIQLCAQEKNGIDNDKMFHCIAYAAHYKKFKSKSVCDMV